MSTTLPHAFEQQQLVIRLAEMKPARRAMWAAYCLIVIGCTLAGMAWTQNRIGGATINFLLSLSLVAWDDMRVKRKAMESCRLEAIETARREFGLALPQTATIEKVARMVCDQLPYRTQPWGHA